MKHWMLVLLLCGGAVVARAQNTVFTYQGRLNSSGSPANGLYDFTFQAFDALSAGSSIGGTVSVNAVGVTNGLFTVLVDLGSTPFTGAARWLQISVSTNGAGSFTILTPRQPLTPSPYAIFAHTAGTVTNGAIANAQLAANSVAGANIQNSTITAGKIASGQVVKSLNGLTDNVSLTQGANVTINTVGNSLQISAPAGGLNLPFSGSASSTGSVFTIANSGTGPAGAFLGKVGIGTASPAFLLHLRGANPAVTLQDTASAANQAGFISFRNDALVETAWVGFGTPGSPDFSVVNARSGGDIILLPFSGNVGIGTTTPQAKLEVNGDGPTSKALRIANGAIQVAGAGVGTSTTVFIHQATADNIVIGYATVIDHPLTNGDPNAVLIITPNWNPGGSSPGIYNNHPIGVSYIQGKWRIFNQDNANLAVGAAFNVLVVKP